MGKKRYFKRDRFTRYSTSNYSTVEDVSFHCLKLDNPFRKKILTLVRWRWFERIVILVIIINCITLALYNPLDRECLTTQCKTLEKLERLIFVFFTLEMVVKMTAMGIFGKKGYFGDAWNILDFVIVLTGIIDVASITNGGFLTIVRLGRVLRPLRAINRVPNIRILVSLLMDTIPMLGNVLVLAFLVFSCFGIMGVQMFQGKLRNRCFLNDDFNQININGTVDHPEFNNTSIPPFFLPSKSIDFICHLNDDAGTRSCNDVPKYYSYKLCQAHYLQYHLHGNKTNTSCIDAHRFYRSCRQDGPNPYYGSISFDNIAMAFIFLFQVVTLEGWSDLMYLVQDAYSFWTWIYFIVLISIGSFFLVNLALVVITMQFSETKRRETRLMKQAKAMGSSQISLYTDLCSIWKKVKQIYSCRKKFESVHHIHQHVHLHQTPSCCEQCKSNNSTPPVAMVTVPNIEITLCDDDSNGSGLENTPLTRCRSASCPDSLATSFYINDWNNNFQTTTSNLMLSIPSEKSLSNHSERESSCFSNSNSSIGDCSIASQISRNNLFVPSRSPTISVHAESISSVTVDGISNSSIRSQTSVSLKINSSNGDYIHTQSYIDTDMCKKRKNKSASHTSVYTSATSPNIKKKRNNVNKNPIIRKLSNFTNTDSMAGGSSTDYAYGSMFDIRNYDKYYVSEIPSKFKQFRIFCRKLSEHSKSQFFIMSTIVLNMLCMAIEHHQQPAKLTEILEYLNIVFIIIFTLEMIIKMLGIGVKVYFCFGFNCFDCLIVVLSLVELTVGMYGSFTAFRSLRLLRIFRLVRPIRHQIAVMLKTTSSVMTFFGLLFLFMFTFAILGMNIFGGKFVFVDRFGVTRKSRSNFDTFLWAMVTVFQILTQEDWNMIMYDGMRSTNMWSTLYFISLMTIGYYVLLNLLVAILVEGFTTPLEKQKMAKHLASLVNKKTILKRTFSLPDILLDNVQPNDSIVQSSRTASFTKQFSCPDDRLSKRRQTLGVVGLGKIKSILSSPLTSSYEGSLENIPETLPMDIQQKQKKSDPVLLSARSTTKTYNGDEKVLEWKHQASINSTKSEEMFLLLPSYWSKKFSCLQTRKTWSLWLFSHHNSLRRHLLMVTKSKYFDYFILVLIIYSCVLLGLEKPGLEEDSQLRKVIDKSTFVLTWIFLAEMIVKVIAQGLLIGDGAYLRNGFNILDCVLVLASLVDIMITWTHNNNAIEIFKGIRVLRATRALRPLRMIRKAPGLKLVVQTLLYSLKPIGNTIMIAAIFFLVFGILGVQLLKGKFNYCFGVEPRMVVSKEECIKHENGYWIRHQYNFDNLIEALMSLFVVSTKDGWVDIMRRGVDATGVDLEPQIDHAPWRILYFVSFLLIGGFLVLNMIVGVVVENFQRCQELQDEKDVARQILQKWREKYKENERSYWKQYCYLRKNIYLLCTNWYWDIGVTVVIFTNVLFMALEHYKMSQAFVHTLEISNIIFTTFYIVEAVLLLIAFGPKRYFKDKWYCFDMLVVVVSIAGLILEHMDMKNITINPTAIKATRMLRVVRALKLLKVAKGLRFLLDHVAETIPQVTNLGLLFSLLFFVYSCLGMQLFGSLECTSRYPCSGMGRHANFRTLGSSMLTLFRIATGDNWSGILKDTLRPTCDSSVSCTKNCCVSKYISPLFFVSFVLFAQFVLVNIVIAVLMKHLQSPEEKRKLQRSSHKSSSRRKRKQGPKTKSSKKNNETTNVARTKFHDLVSKKQQQQASLTKDTLLNNTVGKNEKDISERKPHIYKSFKKEIQRQKITDIRKSNNQTPSRLFFQHFYEHRKQKKRFQRKYSCPEKFNRWSGNSSDYLKPEFPRINPFLKHVESRPEFPMKRAIHDRENEDSSFLKTQLKNVNETMLLGIPLSEKDKRNEDRPRFNLEEHSSTNDNKITMFANEGETSFYSPRGRDNSLKTSEEDETSSLLMSFERELQSLSRNRNTDRLPDGVHEIDISIATDTCSINDELESSLQHPLTDDNQSLTNDLSPRSPRSFNSYGSTYLNLDLNSQYMKNPQRTNSMGNVNKSRVTSHELITNPKLKERSFSSTSTNSRRHSFQSYIMISESDVAMGNQKSKSLDSLQQSLTLSKSNSFIIINENEAKRNDSSTV